VLLEISFDYTSIAMPYMARQLHKLNYSISKDSENDTAKKRVTTIVTLFQTSNKKMIYKLYFNPNVKPIPLIPTYELSSSIALVASNPFGLVKALFDLVSNLLT